MLWWHRCYTIMISDIDLVIKLNVCLQTVRYNFKLSYYTLVAAFTNRVRS